MGKLIPLVLCAFLFAGEDSVLSAIRADAIKKGIPEAYLNKAFAHEGIAIHDKILDRFARPYEKKSWSDYRQLFITESRISKGIEFYGQNQSNLTFMAKRIGVDPFLILSIVGVESNYGHNQGEFTVFNALYTQIAKMPRRAKWAKKKWWNI